MFYEYKQNNSGGRFIFNEDVNYAVLIEADSGKEADKRAEDVGIYFDGVYNDMDCGCCGDRWHPNSYYDDGYPFPHHYGKEIDVDQPIESDLIWRDNQATIVYYKNGEKKIVPHVRKRK